MIKQIITELPGRQRTKIWDICMLHFSTNILCVSLEAPQRGDSNETLQSLFIYRNNRKIKTEKNLPQKCFLCLELKLQN